MSWRERISPPIMWRAVRPILSALTKQALKTTNKETTFNNTVNSVFGLIILCFQCCSSLTLVTVLMKQFFWLFLSFAIRKCKSSRCCWHHLEFVFILPEASDPPYFSTLHHREADTHTHTHTIPHTHTHTLLAACCCQCNHAASCL